MFVIVVFGLPWVGWVVGLPAIVCVALMIAMAVWLALHLGGWGIEHQVSLVVVFGLPWVGWVVGLPWIARAMLMIFGVVVVVRSWASLKKMDQKMQERLKRHLDGPPGSEPPPLLPPGGEPPPLLPPWGEPLRPPPWYTIGPGVALPESDLSGADLSGADLKGAKANEGTRWPDGFDSVAAGVIFE